MAILVLILGLAFSYAIINVFKFKKEKPFSRAIPQPVVVPPPQDNTYLEDKMWYEGQMNFLFKFNEKLISAVGLQNVVQCITEAAYNFLPIEHTVFLTWDKNTEKFTFACSFGWEHEREQESLEIDIESISGFVMRNRDTLVVQDLEKEPYLNKLNKEPYLGKAFISALLMHRDQILGVLHVCGKRIPGPFTPREVSVAINIVRIGAISLQNARLFEDAVKRAAELKVAYDELKEMQDKLIQSEKLKAIGQLASGVAHEMRNPIGIIMQGVSYLEQIIPAEEKDRRDTLDMLKSSAQRADRIVISLLDFSRTSKPELRPEDINLILEESLSLVKTELKNVKLSREMQEGLPKVLVDKNKLMQVFINIFMNAIHAMPSGGRLTIRSFVKQVEETGSSIGKKSDDTFVPGEKAVVIEIEDTGSGISEENLKKIFDPFFTTKEPGKGTGLGLSVVQNIIALHKGLIEVKSQLNKGTKMVVSLRIFKEE